MSKDRDRQHMPPAKKPAKKSEVLFVRVDIELANRLRELAADDERKLSPFLARVLRKYVAKIDATPKSEE